MFSILAVSAALTLSSSSAPLQAAARPETPAVTAAAGTGTRVLRPSAIMGKAREINILTPDVYLAGQERYPVIYLLDGGAAQDWPSYSARIRQAMAEGMIRPAILVGIATEDRQNELTARASDRQIVRRWPSHGQSDRFRRFIAEEVKPWIDAEYRTSGDDAVLGESAAALFIVETFLREPDLFDRYLAVSPSLWWDRQALAREAEPLLTAHPPGDRRLVLTIADEGGQMQSGMDRLVAALRDSAPEGLVWRYEPRHSETHSSIFSASVLDVLRQAYADPEPAQP